MRQRSPNKHLDLQLVTLDDENWRMALHRLRGIIPAYGDVYRGHESLLIQLLFLGIPEDESITRRPFRIFLARGITFFFYFGAQLKIIRWYWARKTIHEKIQARESIRSRLLLLRSRLQSCGYIRTATGQLAISISRTLNASESIDR